MATIKRRADRGGRWEVRFRDHEGKQRARLFDRKVDAENFAASTRVDVLRGTYLDPTGARRTFGDYAAHWLTSQVHRETTAAQVASHLRNHIMPAFGARPMAAVRTSEVQAWVKGRAEVLAPATVEVVFRYVSAIFRAAVADRLIPFSPCAGVKLPKVEHAKVVPLETAAVLALTEAMPDRYRALVTVAAGTGLRQAEALGLTTPRVDFLRRRLVVEQQLVTLTGRDPYLAPPKTTASRRAIPLPTVVVEALAVHVERFPAGEGGLIFTNERGGPIRRNRFGEVWRRAAGGAGVADGVGFHALRHYYASLLIRHGESVKVVQERLGHASAAETLDTYSHLWPDSEDRTRAAVDAVLGQCAPDVYQADAR